MGPIDCTRGSGLKQSEAWVLQAKSDLAAAQAVFREDDASTYCQAIAKFQQTAEKSIKGMIPAPPDLDDASVETIDRLMKHQKEAVIRLCVLAPQGPKQGGVYGKNTEYPFNDDFSPNDWMAPAANSFTRSDVKKAREWAWPLHHSVAKFTSSLRRRK